MKIIALIAFFVVLGTAGGLEQGTMTSTQAFFWGLGGLVVFAIAAKLGGMFEE